VPISVDSAKGYILEEVLAYLIRNAGYRLLVDPIQDPNDLTWERNGLVVIGRGAVHQVDVLGQLEWIPAFTFPIRLFAEAKFRDSRTGLLTVRNAVGTILDINQNYFSLLDRRHKGFDFRPRFQYSYALFSTSGFTNGATRMAMAHQISLIDLSGSEFRDLRDTISNVASRFRNQISQVTIAGIRHHIRTQLRTLPQELSQETDYFRHTRNLSVRNIDLVDVLETARKYSELFIGMANGPFMLVLKAEDPVSFLRYSANMPSHDVIITWNPMIDDGTRWDIQPAVPYDNISYRLTFRLPRLLAQWIFESYEKSQARALDVKQRFFSSITVYTKSGREDRLFRLNFNVNDTLRGVRDNKGEW
jgi:hypothetical protein